MESGKETQEGNLIMNTALHFGRQNFLGHGWLEVFGLAWQSSQQRQQEHVGVAEEIFGPSSYWGW